MVYSAEIAEMVKEYFDQEDWHYDFHEEHGYFTGGVNIGGKLQSVNFALCIKDDYLVNYTSMNLRVEEASRKAVSEYLTRANYGLNLGCFEMDFSDGEVRYRSVAWKAELERDCSQAMAMVLLIPCKMFERYGNGLLAVMFGMKTPEEAVVQAEADE